MAARSASARHEGILIDDESTASELDVDLDLEPFNSTSATSKGVKRRRSQADHADEEDYGEDEPAPSGPRKEKRPEDISVKVEWTDESDGEYERLKKRKRGGGGRGRGRGKGRGRGRGGSTAASRRDVKGKAKATSIRDAANDDANVEDEEDEEDLTIPEYIRQRRKEFDQKRAILKDAGLRLPPDYTDIYFSDDDNDRRRQRSRPLFRCKNKSASRVPEIPPLQTRPQFDSSVRPSRERKDIHLEFSAGVIPACMAEYLRDYQVAGVQFLHQLFVYQKGGILGDDMGLGKTVQVAAFLTAAFGKTGDERDDKRMRKMRRAGPPTGSHGRGEGDDDDQDSRWYPRILVVCPGSLIQNWRNELQRWGWWHVDLYYGSGKDDVLQSARAGRLEIMVTTYTTYKNHRDKINTVRWDAVVADECHILKERKSETTRAMNEVNALCRIGLTGTAIQNKYEELWTLLNWTNPGRFGTLPEWQQTISRPLTIGQSHDATLYQLSLARITAKKLVQNLLPEFFLRRMKSLIAQQLPKKTDRVVFCPLTERQSEAYENFVKSKQVEHLRRVSEPCPNHPDKKRGWCCYKHITPIPGMRVTWFSLVFPTITNLLKLSNHLTLLIPSADSIIGTTGEDDDEQQVEYGDDDDYDDGNGEGGEGSSSRPLPPATSTAKVKTASAAKLANDRHKRAMAVLKICAPDDWETLYRQRDSLINLANPDFCGKWKVLRKLLRFWHENGDKVLVFSHNVRLLRILQHLFHNTSYSVSYLDGSLGYDERQRVVDDFNSDPAQFVFLISTKAGGVGLNITSANKVVIFDPHWNPAYDLQAQDRAYRIGQVRDVDVFRLVSAGTIEEIVYARQIYKQQQANIGYSASTERRYFKGVQQDTERKGEIFGLNNLFTYSADQVVLRDIVNKTNIAEAKVGVHLTAIDMEQAAADKDNEMLVKLEGAASGNKMAAIIKGEGDGDGEAGADKKAIAGSKKDGSSKSDAIQAILASAGVEYTHDNSEVVGSSRVEAQLSRRAEMVLADGYDDGDEEDDLDGHSRLTNRSVFYGHDGSATEDSGSNIDSLSDNDSDAFHEGPTMPPVNDMRSTSLLADTSAAFRDIHIPGHRLQYNPPDDVMRRQFCTMAREAGFATATDFALVVEGWTPEQRRQCLENFYRKRELLVKEQMKAAQETESEGDEKADDNKEDEEMRDHDDEPKEGEVASLVVISEDVVERRELIVPMEDSDEDKVMSNIKGKENAKDTKDVKKDEVDKKVNGRRGANEAKPSLHVKKDEAAVDDKSQVKTEPTLPRIKKEPRYETILSTQGTATQHTQTQATQSVVSVASVRVKQENTNNANNNNAQEDDGRVVVLLSSSPVIAPADREPGREREPDSVVVLPDSVPTPSTSFIRSIHEVIDDSDETDEL
ncbi:hypothetical protein Sste5346_004117 [Sporothrix stenoceras]|uniref:DNA excision repair protein n=1 Tax=Sporothrix stenoceras TaxID=5173 RepID=A0ABR3Z9N8_9PEZI